jgi:DNA-binding response OmpR family regulator
MEPYAFVIEDDVTLLEVFTQALQAAGYRTTAITSGQDGLDALRNEIPNLILLDLHLPNVSGETILNYIRSQARFSSTWVIVASADTVLAEAMENNTGADFVMEKPVSFIQLRDIAIRLHPNNQPDGRIGAGN